MKSGVLGERTDERDFLASELEIPRTPKGTDGFRKNGSIVYAQTEVSPVCCTVVGSAGAYSALTGYRFSYDQLKEMWDEALKRGADPNKGWWGNSGVHLVYEYTRDNGLPKVNYMQVEMGSVEHMIAMRLGYQVASGYKGSSAFKADRNNDGIINDVSPPKNVTYQHWLHFGYSIGDEYDRVVDSYPVRETNIYKFFSANWKKAVQNGLIFKYGYLYYFQ